MHLETLAVTVPRLDATPKCQCVQCLAEASETCEQQCIQAFAADDVATTMEPPATVSTTEPPDIRKLLIIEMESF